MTKQLAHHQLPLALPSSILVRLQGSWQNLHLGDCADTLAEPAALSPVGQLSCCAAVSYDQGVPQFLSSAHLTSLSQVACMMLGDPVPHRLHWPRFSEFSVNNHRMPVYRRNANQAAGDNVRDEAMSVAAHVYPGRVYVSLRCRDSKR